MKFVLLSYLELQWDKVLFGIQVSLRNEFHENSNVHWLLSSGYFIRELIIGTLFRVFGWLSDKVGRKYIMMGGMFIGYLIQTNLQTNVRKTTSKTKPKWSKTTVLAELKIKTNHGFYLYTTNKGIQMEQL
jgi:nitrate/nitrite transporter NarK